MFEVHILTRMTTDCQTGEEMYAKVPFTDETFRLESGKHCCWLSGA